MIILFLPRIVITHLEMKGICDPFFCSFWVGGVLICLLKTKIYASGKVLSVEPNERVSRKWLYKIYETQ